MIMTRKKKINASFNKLDFNTDDFDTDFLSNYFYNNKKLLVTFASLSLLLLLFIFISLTFNSINYTKNEPLSTNHIKSSGTDTDFLPSRTRNLTLVSALSSEDILEKNLIFIGDVHGSLDELKLLIKKLNYDPESDYLVFLGDLIVRGPKPIEVLKYIKELGATSVRGNHEDKVLRWKQFLNDLKKAYGDDEKKKKDKMNDDDEDVEDDEGDDEDDKVVNLRLKRYFKENNLPLDKAIFKSEHKLLATKLDKELHDYLLSFPIVYEAFSINLYAVHGGLLPEKPLTDQEPFDIMNMRNIESGGIPTKSKNVGVSWSRIWNDSQEKSIHPKYIIYGHDASRGLNIKKYSFGLDSRCSHGGMLTALKWYKNGEKKFYSVECDR